MKNLINGIIENLENEYPFLKFKTSKILFDLIEQEIDENKSKEDTLKNFNNYFKLALDPDFDFSNISYFDKNNLETLAKSYNDLRASQILETAELKSNSIISNFVKNEEYVFLISDSTSDFVSVYEIEDFYSLIIRN